MIRLRSQNDLGLKGLLSDGESPPGSLPLGPPALSAYTSSIRTLTKNVAVVSQSLLPCGLGFLCVLFTAPRLEEEARGGCRACSRRSIINTCEIQAWVCNPKNATKLRFPTRRGPSEALHYYLATGVASESKLKKHLKRAAGSQRSPSMRRILPSLRTGSPPQLQDSEASSYLHAAHHPRVAKFSVT